MYWPLVAVYEPPDSLLAIHALADESLPLVVDVVLVVAVLFVLALCVFADELELAVDELVWVVAATLLTAGVD